MPDHWVAGSFIGQEHTLKLIVLLLIVMSIVMFVVVLKTPLSTIRSVVFPDETASESQSTEQPDNAKAAKRDKVRKTTATTSNNSGSKAGGSSSAPSVTKAAEVDQPRTSAGGRASDRSLFLRQPLTISNDSVALYSINSTRGSVRTVLNEGTVVEPYLQVIDGDDSWTLVRVPELNMSGFVHTENLFNQRSGGSAR
jgi:hypothetical protein